MAKPDTDFNVRGNTPSAWLDREGTLVSVSASGTSAATPGDSIPDMWMVLPTVDVHYRQGSGTPVATTSDPIIKADVYYPVLRKIGSRNAAGSTRIAFLKVSGAADGPVYVWEADPV